MCECMYEFIKDNICECVAVFSSFHSFSVKAKGSRNKHYIKTALVACTFSWFMFSSEILVFLLSA